MNLARFSVNRPVTAGILSFGLFFVGLFYLVRLPVALWPQVSFPFVTVLVPFPGSSPEQIEAKVVKPIEASVSGIKGLKKVTSQARAGFAFFILEFRLTVEEREALDSVKERVAGVRGELPREVKDPVIKRVDVGASPILIYGIETALEPSRARKLLDDTVIQSLLRIPGVNEAAVVGVGEDRLELSLNARELAARRIAALDVFEVLRQKLSLVPWGTIETNQTAANVSATQFGDDPKEWQNTVLSLADGRRVRLGEIGQVQKTTDSEKETVEINGKRGLGLVVSKRADANTVATVDAVQKWLATHTLPEGIRLFQIVDQSELIKENEHEVWLALVVGGIFAVIIIFFALTDIKSALISGAALPVAVVGTFIFFHLMDFSINMITLLALALAIGLLIDDAVVVREAIYTEMEKGLVGAEAAIKGTERVASAVLATTMAIVAVFLPVALMGGMVGQFFREFGLTIVIATLISMFVAFTLDPMLSSRFAATPSMLQGAFWQKWRHGLEEFERMFEKIGSWAYRRPILVATMTFLILASGVVLIGIKGIDFLAFEDRAQFVLSIKGRSGQSRERFQQVVTEATKKLEGLHGLREIFVREGGVNSVNTADIRVLFVHKNARSRGLLEMIRESEERLKDLDANWLILDPPPFEGAGMQAPVMLSIYGPDLKSLDEEAQKARQRLLAIPGIAGARIDTGTFGPAFDVVMDRTEVAYKGISPEAVELTGRLALTGLTAGNVGEDNIPFVLRLRPEDRNLTTMSSFLLVPGQKGTAPLFKLVSAEKADRASAIDREQRSRAMILWATLNRKVPLDQVLEQVKKQVIEPIKAPNTAAIAGDAELFEEMLANFAIALIGAVFFIFLVLAAQFENLLRPFVIILSLPLATVGAFYALAFSGNGLAMGSIIGMIFVMGLAAKNGILLVDAIGQWEKKTSLAEAVTQSVRERCRPIFMTSAAMIAGMLPTALMRGSGSEFRSPMALAIIGGVISSTFLTMVVVPSIFGLIGRFRGRGKDLTKNPDKNQKGDHHRVVQGEPLVRQVGGDIPEEQKSHRSHYDQALAIVGVGVALWGGLWAQKAQAEAKETLALRDEKISSLEETQEDGVLREAYGILGKLPGEFVQRVLLTFDAEGAEALKNQAMDKIADASRASSRLAFLGGAQIAASRQWTRPGLTQTTTLPLPAQLGGPQTIENVILPTQKDQLMVGAKIPLFSTQAIKGLALASAIEEQRQVVKEAAAEQRYLNHSQILLEFTLARSMAAILERASLLASNRLSAIKERVKAGTLSSLDMIQGETVYQQTRLDLSQAKARATLASQKLETKLKISPQEVPQGQPRFPSPDLRGQKTQSDTLGKTSPERTATKGPSAKALEALRVASKVSAESAKTQDAAFYPTLSLSLSQTSQWYDQNPSQDPQKVAALEFEWILLDGGQRRRQVADAERQRLELGAQEKELEESLDDTRRSYGQRRLEALEVLRSAMALRQAALKAQSVVQESWRAGLTTSSEVQKTDENLVRSEWGILQALAQIQGLELEALMAFGQLSSLPERLKGEG